MRGPNFEEKLRSSFSAHNYDIIERFSAKCSALGLTPNRIRFYRNYARMMSRWVTKDFESLDRTDIESIVSSINSARTNQGKKYSDLTRRGFLIALRKIVQFSHGLEWDEEFPACVAWIKGKVMRVERGTVKPSDLLTAEELAAIAQQAPNPRDKAWFSLSVETGWRPDEIFNIRVGDIKFTDSGALISIHGYKRKQEKQLLVVNSVPRLRAWLECHPAKDNSEAPLWSAIYRPKAISRNYFRIRLKRWAEKAGIKKRVWPYLLRHTSITRDDYRLSDAEAKIYYGWAANSNMRGVYSHLTSDNVNARIAGKVADRPKLEMRKCPTCGHENSFENAFCNNCSRPLTETARVQREKELTQDLRERIADEVARVLNDMMKLSFKDEDNCQHSNEY